MIFHITLPGGADQIIDQTDLFYQNGNVVLVMFPQINHLTWEMWSFTDRAIYWFVNRYGFFEFEFDVLEAGVQEPVGVGALTSSLRAGRT